MSVSTVTISSLISSCPAPVSTAEGASSALKWFNIVNVFTIEHDATEMPNKTSIIEMCERFIRELPYDTTDYVKLNQNLMWVKWALDGIIQAHQ